jgi:Do/DeqQ family serine protease
MSDAQASLHRTVFWAILVGVLVGVATVKLMDGWPNAKAEGAPQAAGSKDVFTTQAETFRHAANLIAGSVVNVTTIEKVRMVVGDPEDLFGGFMRFYRNRRIQEGKRIRGFGSGFIFDSRGYILTNNHVVEGGEEWVIKLADKRELTATLKGADPQTDLAVLQVGAGNLPAATLGDSDKLEVGDWVLAAGNPFGMLEQTVTAGIISAKGRRGLGLSNYEDYLQTDAAINQGNSGGPLVDLNGHVIGINSAIYSRSGGYQGIGFAIPINQARKIAEKLIKSGEVVRGWMGIEVRELKEAEAKRLGLADGVGLSVEGIYMRGPAQKGGIEPDDVVVAIDGHPLRSAAELRDLVADKEPDSKIQVKLFRKGKEKAVEVLLAAQPRSWGTGRPER